jgi:hypothetical protein
LGALLDESWRQYLVLPQGVFSGEGVPTLESLRVSLQRFDTVAKETRYKLLWQRSEFQQTHALLRAYVQQVEAEGQVATPPPASSANTAPGARIR